METSFNARLEQATVEIKRLVERGVGIVGVTMPSPLYPDRLVLHITDDEEPDQIPAHIADFKVKVIQNGEELEPSVQRLWVIASEGRRQRRRDRDHPSVRFKKSGKPPENTA